jgi:acetoin utilization deacetylase AcuC-like enzyme
MVRGRIVPPVDTPERAKRLRDRMSAIGLVPKTPADQGMADIAAVHDARYLAFLETAHQRFSALPGAGDEVLPNVHPYRGAGPDYAGRGPARPSSIVGQAGWYLGDLAVAMGAGTWPAAYASAQSAIAAAERVRAGTGEAYALCRPPGHHAYADRASGFCFLNTAAIAALILRSAFRKVAVLDFDTHHGDGTQAIFYSRSDVFYGSVHTDPDSYYPFYTGYADERGHGAGEGANLNIPLPQGSGDDAFLDANRQLLVAALAAGAEALVISAGWDAHQDDPLSKLAVTTTGFRGLGGLYGEIPLPTVIIQEGGYSVAAIDEVVPAFFEAFLNERRTP